jgi:hypothetical protein
MAISSSRSKSTIACDGQLNLMKFSLAHDPGQAEQQTVMIGARIVDALAIGDQHSK